METLLLSAAVSAVVSAVTAVTVIHFEQKYQSKRLNFILQDLQRSEKQKKSKGESKAQETA